MRKFYEHVVYHRKVILIIYIFLAVFGLFLGQFISVNYDMNDYLPDDSHSTVSLEIMQEEFDGDIPNARIMVKDVTIPQALEYKHKLYEVTGVTDVLWLDDAVSITQPIETADKDTVETYYKDNTALFTVTIDEEHNTEAISEIRKLIGENNSMSGTAVSTAEATESTVSQIPKIAIFAVIFTFFVLLLTTNSWLEPFVVLVGIGIAIAINMGTNLIFGEISFVTNAAGNILQLAVSLDYSVFLIHRFAECRKETSDKKEAMVNALCMSTSSILSSGLTTVIGFLALTLMRFKIGPDLGWALAKGITISLITVFICMPAIILTTHKWIDKTHHRSFLPKFDGFGRFVTKVMIPSVCVFAVLLIPSYLASNSNNFYYGASYIFDEKTQLGADTVAIEDIFGKNDTYVLLVPEGDTATEQALSDELHTLPQVTSIISYVDTVGAEIPEAYLDENTLSQLKSENYSRMVLSVDTDFEGKETFALIDEIRETAQDYYPDTYYFAGQGISTNDLMNAVTSDMVKVNLIAIAAVFVVLLLNMKSITLPILLVLSIETAIWINLSIPYFLSDTIFYISYLIISTIQLGATVDYAILFTDRYMEYRQSLPKKESIVQTVSAVTVSILTSGIVLTVVGFLLGYLSSHGILAQLGIFLGIGTLCSMMIVLFVLPGLLYLFDGVIMHTTKGAKYFKKDKEVK